MRPGTALPGDADLILLPGSKATIADLKALYDAGWDIDIRAHHSPRRCRAWGCAVATRCWENGSRIRAASRDRQGGIDGLGLLDIATMLTGEKALVEVSGRAVGSADPRL